MWWINDIFTSYHSIFYTDAANSKQTQVESLNILAGRKRLDGRFFSITEDPAPYITVQNAPYFTTTFVDIRPYVQHRSARKVSYK